ncbi:MAG TPA: hypothetical protein VFQ45_04700, partial [Longimicrobium sp.]|nr:hypothetical protein [Longimicrobium sp.]
AACSAAAIRAAGTEVVELKGTGTFNPSPALAEAIACVEPAALSVRVKFGGLASGMIAVRRVFAPMPDADLDPGDGRCHGGCHGGITPRWRGAGAQAPGEGGERGGPPSFDPGTGGGGGGVAGGLDPAMPFPRARPGDLYETVEDDPFIALTHPALPGGAGAPPRLHLSIRDSVVTGYVSFFPSEKAGSIDRAEWYQAHTPEKLFGWKGLTKVVPASAVNEVKGGVLRYGMPEFTFQMENRSFVAGTAPPAGDGPSGSGSFLLTDEAQSFDAGVDVEAPGIGKERMSLKRAAGKIFGAQDFQLTLAPTDRFGGKFSGKLHGTFADGVLVIQGTATYRSKKLNGSVTMMLAPAEQAWTHVGKQLVGSANPPPAAPGGGGGLVLVGWGTVNFALNEWLTGSVSVVVDPDGYITSHGILRPTKQFQFLNDPDEFSWKKNLVPPIKKSVTFATIWAASVEGTLRFRLDGGARVGPGKVYGLEVEGSFSTRPGSALEASATGRINLSAWASIQATISGAVEVTAIGGTIPVGSVEVTLTGTATLRAYAELAPRFEFIKAAGADEGNFRISGSLEVAGAVDLGLSGKADFSVLGFGPTIDFGRFELPIGRLGARATISHVIGSGDPIELDYELTGFDERKFGSEVEDLVQEDADADRGKHHEKLEQAAGTVPPAEVDNKTDLAWTFPMNGVEHRLYTAYKPGPVLMMASTEGRVVDKLHTEIAAAEARAAAAEGDEAALATQEAAAARTIATQAKAVESSLTELQAEGKQNPDAAGVGEVAGSLTNFAAQYDKTDLGDPTEVIPEAAGAVAVDPATLRYVITNVAELNAVKAAKPAAMPDEPEGAAPDADKVSLWNDYSAAGTGYFDRYIAAIEKDLTPPKKKVRHDPPYTWPGYLKARKFYDSLRERKEFQDAIRNTILDEDAGQDPARVEIDVGVKKGRREVKYADVVVHDELGNLDVYSAKVRNVTEQVAKAKAAGKGDLAVQKWISDQLDKDVREAIDLYGGQVSFRRKFMSTATGRAATRPPKHPLYEKPVFVKKVILVWRGDADLVPERFRDYIEVVGNGLGAKYRKTISCEVKLLP